MTQAGLANRESTVDPLQRLRRRRRLFLRRATTTATSPPSLTGICAASSAVLLRWSTCLASSVRSMSGLSHAAVNFRGDRGGGCARADKIDLVRQFVSSGRLLEIGPSWARSACWRNAPAFQSKRSKWIRRAASPRDADRRACDLQQRRSGRARRSRRARCHRGMACPRAPARPVAPARGGRAPACSGRRAGSRPAQPAHISVPRARPILGARRCSPPSTPRAATAAAGTGRGGGARAVDVHDDRLRESALERVRLGVLATAPVVVALHEACAALCRQQDQPTRLADRTP